MNKEEVMKILDTVYDPELHKSLVELDMVRNIIIKDKRIALEIVLTIIGCPLKNTIEEDVRKALNSIGFEEVNISFTAMNHEEKERLRNKLTDNKNLIEENKLLSGKFLDTTNLKTISIISGKGGVGKSTVSLNLAITLVRKGFNVGLIDADIYGFSIPSMLGIEGKPTSISDKFILPIEKEGLKVMSMGFFVPDNSPIVWRGPMLGKMLKVFFEEVYWGELDYLILDLPPGTGDVALDINMYVPHSKELVVTTPHKTAAHVAARAGAMAQKTEHDIIGVVENMSYYECKCGEKGYIFGTDGGKNLAKKLGVELLVQIPLIIQDEESYIYKKGSKIEEKYQQLADLVIERV